MGNTLGASNALYATYVPINQATLGTVMPARFMILQGLSSRMFEALFSARAPNGVAWVTNRCGGNATSDDIAVLDQERTDILCSQPARCILDIAARWPPKQLRQPMCPEQ